MADDTPQKVKKPFATPGAWEEARSLVHRHRKRLILGMALMLALRVNRHRFPDARQLDPLRTRPTGIATEPAAPGAPV